MHARSIAMLEHECMANIHDLSYKKKGTSFSSNKSNKAIIYSLKATSFNRVQTCLLIEDVLSFFYQSP